MLRSKSALFDISTTSRRLIFQIPTSPSDRPEATNKVEQLHLERFLAPHLLPRSPQAGVMLALQRLLYQMEVDAKEEKPSSVTEVSCALADACSGDFGLLLGS